MRSLFYKKSFIFSILSVLCLLYAGTCQHEGHYLQVKSEQNKRPCSPQDSIEVAIAHNGAEDTWSPVGRLGGRLLGGMEQPGGGDVKDGHRGSASEADQKGASGRSQGPTRCSLQ